MMKCSRCGDKISHFGRATKVKTLEGKLKSIYCDRCSYLKDSLDVLKGCFKNKFSRQNLDVAGGRYIE